MKAKLRLVLLLTGAAAFAAGAKLARNENDAGLRINPSAAVAPINPSQTIPPINPSQTIGPARTLGDARVPRLPPPTSCAPVDAATVAGVVTNPGPDVLRVEGMVRFVFASADTMSRPVIQVQSAALIPPGAAMVVAVARVGSSLLPGETCRLDVSGAVR